MKASVWMFGVLAALVAMAKGDGVCYDPKHADPSTSMSSVASDMKLIKDRGFTMVRTYICKLGNENMAKVVAQSGLAAALGVPYANNNYNDAKAHADAAIEAAKSGNVQYIFVGNENLMSGNTGAAISEMKSLISYIKGQVGGGVKVGTVQRSAELSTSIPGGMADLVNACDVVGTNIHPFFHPNQQVDGALDETKRQWNGILSSGLPGIGGKLILTETGWPSEGCITGSCGSIDGAAKYFNAYKGWNLDSSKRFYFQAFDQPYRSEAYEKKYGIWNADGSQKFTAGGDGKQVTQAPATTTPAPTQTTAAPTTTPTPSQTPTPTPSPSATNATTPEPTTEKPASDASKEHGSSSSEAGVVATVTTSVQGSQESANLKPTPQTLAEEDTADHKAGAKNVKGDLESETIPEANNVETRASASGSSFVSVFVMTIMGVGIVAVAAGFIYKARQKAAELDRESKGEDDLSITPGGACVL